MNQEADKAGTYPIWLRPSMAVGHQTPPVSCVLSFPGLPGSDNKIYDRSPYANIGTITGAVWKVLPSGLWHLSFDGIDDYIDCGNSGALDFATGEATFIFWVKPGVNWTTSTQATLWDKRSGNIPPVFTWNNINKLACYVNDGWAVKGLTASLVAGAWYHLACTLKSGTAQNYVFINGVDDSTAQASRTFVATTVSALIGKTQGGAADLNGSVGEVRAYNRALSLLEIQNDYLATKWMYQ